MADVFATGFTCLITTHLEAPHHRFTTTMSAEMELEKQPRGPSLLSLPAEIRFMIFDLLIADLFGFIDPADNLKKDLEVVHRVMR
jgi:hypothetical protein